MCSLQLGKNGLQKVKSANIQVTSIKSNILSISLTVQRHLYLNVTMFEHKRGLEFVTSQQSRHTQGLLRNRSRS